MGTILMVGTRKGLWIGRSDDRREDWSWSGPHHDMEEVYSCHGRHQGREPAAVRRRVLELAGTAGALVRRPRRDLAGDSRAAGSGSPRGAGPRSSGSGSWCPAPTDGVVYAGTEPGAVWKSVDGGETFALEEALWNHPAEARVGRRLRRPGVPHDPPAPDRRRLGHRGDLDRRRLPDHRRRRLVGAAQPGDPRRLPARGPALPGVRPVRAQGDPAPEPTGAAVRARTTAASTAPTTRAGPGRRSATTCRATSGSRSSSIRTGPDTIYVFPLGGGDGRYPPEGRARGLAVRRRRGVLDAARRRPARPVLRRASCATPCAPTPTTRPGSTSAAATEPCGRRPTTAPRGGEIVSDLPDVMSVKVGVVE